MPQGEPSESEAPKGKSPYVVTGVDQVYPDPDQPRRHFGEIELEELASSIRVHGVIQPLIVRKRDGGGYTLIAGERRWRASQKAGLTEIPVVIQSLGDHEAFERALVENIQRSDLNPIEEALAYERLAADYGQTQQEIADRVGKKRSTVANTMRLLKLPRVVREMVEQQTLAMGHARALLSLGSDHAIVTAAKTIADQGLSVRAAEVLVAKPKDKKPATATKDKSPSVRDLEQRLTKGLGAKCSVKTSSGGKGVIQIAYRNLDDLDRLLEELLDN